MIVWEGTEEQMTAVGVGGTAPQTLLGRRIDPRAMERLQPGPPEHVGMAEHDLTGQDTQPLAKELGVKPKPMVCLVPLAFGGQLHGMLAATSAMERMALAEDLHRRAGEARFQALIQHASDVITIVQPDGTIGYVSPAVAYTLGVDPHALVGQSLRDLVDARCAPLVPELLGTTVNGIVLNLRDITERKSPRARAGPTRVP